MHPPISYQNEQSERSQLQTKSSPQGVLKSEGQRVIQYLPSEFSSISKSLFFYHVT
jgi:hypothetical protein